MEEALDGRFSGHPLWPAFHHTVRRFGIPHEYLREMIDGVVSDLEPRRFADLRRTLPLLLPGGFGGGADDDSHFRFRHAQRAATGRKMRNRLSAHQHSARHPRGFRVAAASTCRARTWPASALPKPTWPAAIAPPEFLRLMQFESGPRARLLPRIAAAARSDSPAQPAFAVGADHDLFPPARPHRSRQLRCFPQARAAVAAGEILDHRQGAAGVAPLALGQLKHTLPEGVLQ